MGRIVCSERARCRLGAKSRNAVPFAADEAVWVDRFFEETAKMHDAPCAGKVAGYARSLAAVCCGVPYEVQCSSETDAALVSEILRKFLFHYECPEKNLFVFWVRTADKWILAALAAHLSGAAFVRRDRASDTKKVPRHPFLSMGQGQVLTLRAQALRRTVDADPLASFFPLPAGLS